MAAHRLRQSVGRLFAMGPELGSGRRAFSAFQAFTEVLRLPSKQLTKLVFPLEELHEHFVPGSRPDLHLNIFHPSLEDIARAESFFTASARNRIEYLTSAVRLDHAPDLHRPERLKLESPKNRAIQRNLIFTKLENTLHWWTCQVMAIEHLKISLTW